jgi:hypothetical protein
VRFAAEAKINFQAAKEANAKADAEYAHAEASVQRANRLEFAAFQLTEACRAEVPRIIATIADPEERGRVAAAALRSVFERAAAGTDAAAGDALLSWPSASGVPAGGDR